MEELHTMFRNTLKHQAPSMLDVSTWMESFFEWMFLGSCDTAYYEGYLKKRDALHEQLVLLLRHVRPLPESQEISTTFFDSVPMLYNQLQDDLEALFHTDPAAFSRTEIIVSYPGFFAVCAYRISHWLWDFKISVIPRLLSEYAHSRTGADIHPGAKIGNRFVIDHGTGVVIGETSSIGNNVKVYQGVTLGAVSVHKEKADLKRHPTVEDDVTIYSNATILGGKTLIGKGSVIGGNVWITASVPAYSLVYHKAEMIVKEARPSSSEPIDFVI